MGIINLKLQNQGLLIKHLHKFYNKADIPWVSLLWSSYYDGVVPQATILCGSFWWKHVFKLSDNYRALASATVNRGDSVLFWSDAWQVRGSSMPLRHKLPRLFSYDLDDKISVSDFYTCQDRSSYFQLPISQQAALELDTLNNWIHNVHMDPNENDIWSWAGSSSSYLAKSYYTIMHSHLPTIEPCRWLWASRCTLKIEVFAWLLFFDRLNTKDLLVRRHWRSLQEDNLCVLYC